MSFTCQSLFWVLFRCFTSMAKAMFYMQGSAWMMWRCCSHVPSIHLNMFSPLSKHPKRDPGPMQECIRTSSSCQSYLRIRWHIPSCRVSGLHQDKVPQLDCWACPQRSFSRSSLTPIFTPFLGFLRHANSSGKWPMTTSSGSGSVSGMLYVMVTLTILSFFFAIQASWENFHIHEKGLWNMNETHWLDAGISHEMHVERWESWKPSEEGNCHGKKCTRCVTKGRCSGRNDTLCFRGCPCIHLPSFHFPFPGQVSNWLIGQ